MMKMRCTICGRKSRTFIPPPKLPFCEVTQVLTYLNEQEHRKLDYAFLDTCLCGLPGIELARVIREYNPKTKITEGSLKPLTYHPNQSNITISKAIPIYLFSSYPHSRAVIRTA